MATTDPTFPERRAIADHRNLVGSAENLGRIVLVWNHIEATSHIVLWGVISPNRLSDEVRPLTRGQSITWVWDRTEELLGLKRDSNDLVAWFKTWRERAGEGLRKRNEAVHAWWLPTGEAKDPYKVLDMIGSKARKGVRDDVIEGGSVTLLEWIDEISAISEDQLVWLKGPLTKFLLPGASPPGDPRPADQPRETGDRSDPE